MARSKQTGRKQKQPGGKEKKRETKRLQKREKKKERPAAVPMAYPKRIIDVQT